MAGGVDDVERLYREARAIVFSQYEGFGYPVIRGLAHGEPSSLGGRTCRSKSQGITGAGGLADRRASWSSRWRWRSRLGELLALAISHRRLPDGYPEVAGRMLAVIEERLAKPLRSNWSARQEVFGFIDADRRSGWR